MHHDAITSTSPDSVLLDYMNRIKLTNGKIELLETLLQVEFEVSKEKESRSTEEAETVKLLSKLSRMSVYNSLPYTRKETANFTLQGDCVKLYNCHGVLISQKGQLVKEALVDIQNPTPGYSGRSIVYFEVTALPFS